MANVYRISNLIEFFNSSKRTVAAATVSLSVLAGSSALTMAGVVGVATFVSTAPANAKTCVSQSISTSAEAFAIRASKSRERAKRRALRKWKRTAKQFGSEFSSFGRASNTSIVCGDIKGVVKSGKVCTAKGTPCSK